MNRLIKYFLFGIVCMVLMVVELDASTSFNLQILKHTHAVVGAPATPLSVAGVARRTAIRSTVVVVSAQPSSVSPQSDVVSSLSVGTVVSALPAGCSSIQLNGVNYFNCQGTYFRPAYQGQNVVYIVENP